MRIIGLFIQEWFRKWWGLMSCAAFTFLGLYVTASHKSNAWIVAGSAIVGFVFFFVASYRAWRRQYDLHQEELAKNERPDIRGDYYDFERITLSDGGMLFNLRLSLCNHRHQPTTVKSVFMTLSDDSALETRPRCVSMTVSDRPVLARGIEVSIDCKATLPLVDAMFLNCIEILVTDAFENEYQIPSRQAIRGMKA